MRLPGTHNSKYGDLREVVCEYLDARAMNWSDLESWLGEAPQPILTRKPPRVSPVSGDGAPVTEAGEENPFTAQALGYKPALDVEARLDAMA